jgi:hypothetical protein
MVRCKRCAGVGAGLKSLLFDFCLQSFLLQRFLLKDKKRRDSQEGQKGVLKLQTNIYYFNKIT